MRSTRGCEVTKISSKIFISRQFGVQSIRAIPVNFMPYYMPQTLIHLRNRKKLTPLKKFRCVGVVIRKIVHTKYQNVLRF